MNVSVKVMGVRLTPDIRTWENRQRKVGSLLAFYASLAITVLALTLWIAWGGPRATYWVFFGLLVVLLLFMVALMVLTPPKPKAEPAEATPAPEAAPAMAAPAVAPPEAEPAEAAPEAPAGPQVITLRCGDCSTIFDVTDTGARPLYHTCPGCGAEGALGEPEAAPEPEPAAWAPPAEAAPAPAPAAAPTAKKLRLRCGGCKEIFSIDDTGERPLRRPCPHCGRMGQIS